MGSTLEELDKAQERLRSLTGELRMTSSRLLECIDEAGSDDGDTGANLTAAIEELSLLGRVQHGMLMQFLARAHQARAVPGGVPAFLAETQGVSHGRARSLVEDAQRITVDPEINKHLSEGRLSPEGTRVLARTLKAVAGAEADTQRQAVVDAIATIETEGVTRAVRQIPRLEEETDPGPLDEVVARQRSRSFARMVTLEHGACRYDILLDAERSLKLRAALDAFASGVRQRRSKGLDIVPKDVRTADQIRAEAFTRLAEVFLNASNENREAEFKIPTLLYGTLDVDNPLAETVYGDRLPGSLLSRPDDPATDVVLFDRDGRVISLNGEPIDKGSGVWSRLGRRRQRKGIAFRSQMTSQ